MNIHRFIEPCEQEGTHTEIHATNIFRNSDDWSNEIPPMIGRLNINIGSEPKIFVDYFTHPELIPQAYALKLLGTIDMSTCSMYSPNPMRLLELTHTTDLASIAFTIPVNIPILRGYIKYIVSLPIRPAYLLPNSDQIYGLMTIPNIGNKLIDQFINLLVGSHYYKPEDYNEYLSGITGNSFCLDNRVSKFMTRLLIKLMGTDYEPKCAVSIGDYYRLLSRYEFIPGAMREAERSNNSNIIIQYWKNYMRFIMGCLNRKTCPELSRKIISWI